MHRDEEEGERVGEPVEAVHVDAGDHVEQVVDDAAAAVEEPDPDGHRRDDGHRPGQQQRDLQDEAHRLADGGHQQGEQQCRSARVRTAVIRQKASERATTRPDVGVGGERRCSCRARRTRRGWPNCCGEAELLERGDELPDERVAHAEEQDADGGDEEQVRGELRRRRWRRSIGRLRRGLSGSGGDG